MFENKFVQLFITTLWMTGGFGVLLSLLYMGQYRRRNWWNIGNTVSVPRTLLPLYGSLLLFCVGLALQAFVTNQAMTFWVAVGWSMIALIFMVQGIGVVRAAIAEGWDEPLAADDIGGPSSGILSGVALLLLVANGALLGWLGFQQLEAGRFDTAYFWRDERATVATTPTPMQPTVFNAGVAQASQTETAPIASTAKATLSPGSTDTETTTETTGPVAFVPSTSGVSAIMTVAPQELRVTPTSVPLEGRTGLPTTVSADVQATPLPSTILTSTTLLPTPVLSTTLLSTPLSATAETDQTTVNATDNVTDNVTDNATPAPVTLALTVQSGNGANMREGPSLNDEVILVLPNRLAAVATGRTARGDWLAIQLENGTTGWISAPLATLAGPADRLPIVE